MIRWSRRFWVRSGKETVLQVELQLRVFELSDKVEVTAVNYMQPSDGHQVLLR